MKKLQFIEQKLGASNGTFLFAFSTLFAKVIGAVYKLPLYNLLGGKGIGLYQMVFPVYALLLTLSGGGIPSAMTKLISSGYNEKEVLAKCLKIFLPIGLIFSFLLFFLGKYIAILQGDAGAEFLYKAISPSVVTVCAIACLRGYFQGKCNFKPTAISNLSEQLVKAVSGLIALLFVNGDYKIKVIWACVAVSVSEIFTLAILFLIYKKEKKKNVLMPEEVLNKNSFLSVKSLLLFILPITLSSLLLPLANFCDSFIAINSLKRTFGDSATAVYGVYTGGVDCIITLPVSILSCLSLGFLPKLKNETLRRKSLLSVFILSFFASIAVFIFAPLASEILFSNSEFKNLLVILLRYASITVFLHSSLHASANLLLSLGKQKVSLLTLFIGVSLKTVLNLLLIKIPQINVFGMIISDIVCYFVALILNLLYIYYANKIKQKKGRTDINENNVSRFRRWTKLFIRKSI